MLISAPPSSIRNRALAAVVLVMLFGALLIPHAAATPGDESSFVAQVNQYRAGQGLPPLQVDNQLTSLARGWATQMRDGVCGAGNYICHASPISAGVTHDWAKLGENVGTGGDVNSVMAAFWASEGHRNNIKDPEFTHIGVGVVWQDGRLFTTHRFMSLRNAPATTTTSTSPPPTSAPFPTTAPPAAPSSATTTPPTTTAPTTTAPATAAAPTAVSPTDVPPTNVPPPGDDGETVAAPDGLREAPPATEARVDVVIAALTELH